MLSSMTYASDIDATAKYLTKQNLDHWGILALNSYGNNVNEKTLKKVASNVTTDKERYLLAAAAIGENVLEVSKEIANCQKEDGKFADRIDGTGDDLINAHVWGIISLYTANYEAYDKEKALQWLKENQNQDGGFAIFTGHDQSDLDITGMALIAYSILGMDKNTEEVQKAITFIEENITKKESCESYAWYILARVKLGLEVDKNLLDILEKYRLADGSYVHLETLKQSNYMSTWHGLLATSDVKNKISVFEKLHNVIRFVDLKKTDYAYTEITGLVNKGVISGYGDSTFRPNTSVKRSEFSKFLVYGLGLQNKISKESNQFIDLKGHWANKIVNVAVNQQLIKGVENNRFAPEARITGAEVATMLVRAKGLEEKAQAIKGDHWYDGYVQVAQDTNLLYTNFNSKEYATRAQCAEVIYRLTDN